MKLNKDALLEAHLKKAPKINSKVLHPGKLQTKCPSSTSIEQYFPERKEAAKFLRLQYLWWIISNAKDRFSNHILGHAAKKK